MQEILRAEKQNAPAEPAPQVSPGKLVAELRPLDDLQPIEIERMHQLFAKIYAGYDYEVFVRELLEKDVVALLKDHDSIQGFSTVAKTEINSAGKSVNAFYAGESVIAPDCRGAKELEAALLKYLWKEKAKRPFRRAYLFMVAKGYKSYLRLSNNFAVHFPRHEQTIPPHFATLMDEFYGKKFGAAFEARTKLIRKSDAICRSSEDLREIDPWLMQIPQVAFFQTRNPAWRDGVELACVAEVSFFLPLNSAAKKIAAVFSRRKNFRRRLAAEAN
jgi:hypothetical protein